MYLIVVMVDDDEAEEEEELVVMEVVVAAQCIITRKKSIVIFSSSKTLLDYSRSFFKTLAIVKPLREIETDAKVAFTKHYRGRGGGCSRNPPFSSVEYEVLCNSDATVNKRTSTRICSITRKNA